MVSTQLVGLAVMVAIVVALSVALLHESRDPGWLALPLAIPLVALTAGIALAVASLNALYRDVEHFVAALLLPWFFLTPVLYALEGIPGVQDHPRLVDLVHWGSPLTPGLEAFRDPVFFGVAPAAGDVLYLLAAAVVSLALGA